MIAIIGKSNSGKTTLLNKIANHAFKVINSDLLVNELYQKNQPGFKLLVNVFGLSIVSDSGLNIDKIKIIKLIKKDPHNIKIINDLIHPLIISYLQKNENKNCVVEISAISYNLSLVFNDLFDGVIIMKPNYFIHKFFEFKNNSAIKKIKKQLTRENNKNLKLITFKDKLILKNTNNKTLNKAIKFIKQNILDENSWNDVK